MLQLKKAKIGQSCNKQQQTTTNNNNKKRPFFLPKINKVFLRPILQNLKVRSRPFWTNLFLKMILSTSRKNRIYPSLTHLTAKFFPLKRVLKNRIENCAELVTQLSFVLELPTKSHSSQTGQGEEYWLRQYDLNY